MNEPKWKDVTSYSQGTVERVPRTWELDLGELTITVTRRVGLDGWFLIEHRRGDT